MTTVPAIFSRCFFLASAPLPPVSSSQQFVIWVNPILSTTLFLDWGFGEKSSHTWEKFRFFFLINGLSVVTQMIYFKFSFVKVRSLCLTSFFSHFCMYMAFFFPSIICSKDDLCSMGPPLSFVQHQLALGLVHFVPWQQITTDGAMYLQGSQF